MRLLYSTETSVEIAVPMGGGRHLITYARGWVGGMCMKQWIPSRTFEMILGYKRCWEWQNSLRYLWDSGTFCETSVQHWDFCTFLRELLYREHATYGYWPCFHVYSLYRCLRETHNYLGYLSTTPKFGPEIWILTTNMRLRKMLLRIFTILRGS